MKPSSESAKSTPLTFDDLRNKTIGDIDPVPTAIAALAASRQAEAAALAVVEQAQADQQSPNPRVRRAAARTYLDKRAEWANAQDDTVAAGKAIAMAKRDAFDRVAPVIEREHCRLLKALDPLLRDLLARLDELRAVEGVSDNFLCHIGSDMTPAQLAVPRDVCQRTAQLLDAVRRWREQVND